MPAPVVELKEVMVMLMVVRGVAAVLLWPLRKIAGMYMLATYRHRDRCQVRGVVVNTVSGRPVAGFEVRHGGVRIGLLVKNGQWQAVVPSRTGPTRLPGQWRLRRSAVFAVQQARDEQRATDGVGVVATRRPY